MIEEHRAKQAQHGDVEPVDGVMMKSPGRIRDFSPLTAV
jgi:hypothetical protein